MFKHSASAVKTCVRHVNLIHEVLEGELSSAITPKKERKNLKRRAIFLFSVIKEVTVSDVDTSAFTQSSEGRKCWSIQLWYFYRKLCNVTQFSTKHFENSVSLNVLRLSDNIESREKVPFHQTDTDHMFSYLIRISDRKMICKYWKLSICLVPLYEFFLCPCNPLYKACRFIVLSTKVGG